MWTIEQAVKHYEVLASRLEDICMKPASEYPKQTAEWLRELVERRKADSCEGCKHIGLWENEYEYGISCPCLRCRRRARDNYEPERRVDG